MSQQQQQEYVSYPGPNNGAPQSNTVGPPKNVSNDDLLLYIVCFFCPPLAVFWLKNGCEQEVIIAAVLWCLFWFPGFIYAIYLVMQHHKEVQEKNPQQGGTV